MFCGLCQDDVPAENIHICPVSKETVHPATAEVLAEEWKCLDCGKGLLE